MRFPRLRLRTLMVLPVVAAVPILLFQSRQKAYWASQKTTCLDFQVIDAETNTYIPSAIVELIQTHSGGPIYATTTHTDGHATLTATFLSFPRNSLFFRQKRAIYFYDVRVTAYTYDVYESNLEAITGYDPRAWDSATPLQHVIYLRKSRQEASAGVEF